MSKFYNNNDIALDCKIKNLETNLYKAKDIAELGAKAIESPYISTLFDSQQNFAEILKGTPILTQIYMNVQRLVLYSKEQKEENLKLNDRIKQLVEKSGDNDSDKNIIAKLRESMSLLEKEKIQLNGKINELKSNNAKQEQEMKALKSKFYECNVEMIEKARENSANRNRISELRESMSLLEKQNIYLYEKLNIFESSNKEQKQQFALLYSELNDYSEKMQQAIEDLSNDKAQLEEKCVNALFEIEERKKYESLFDIALQAADEKIHSLSQSEKALKAQSEELRKRLHQSIYDKKQSDEEKEQLCTNENRFKKYNEEIEKNLKCQKDENAYLKYSLAKHVQKITSLEANIKELKTNVKEKECLLETNIKLTAELNSIKRIAADLETRNERQAGELKRFYKSNEKVAALLKKSRIKTDDPQNTV